jgi:thiol-disulfide isomerase/thioredoxin
MRVAPLLRVACSAALLALGAALAGPATGHEPHQGGTPLDLELAGLAGHFVRLADLPARVTVINFWRSDCPPCLRELPLLSGFARMHAEVNVVAVAVQSRTETERTLPIDPAPLIVLVGSREPEGTMRRLGARSTAIPYTAVLHPDRSLCASRTGEVSLAWLEEAARVCDVAAR